MAIMIQGHQLNLMCEGKKIVKRYCEGKLIYSSGNTVTYVVDSGVSYTEEVDEGASCLTQKTFTPTKSGWTFVGWMEDKTASGSVLSSKVMLDSPITLYAVFRQTITVTYYNGSTAKQTTTGYRYYNSGNISNPSFTLTQAALSGWTARGWSTGTAGNSGITYSNGVTFTRDANITLYGMYYQTIILSYNGNGSTSGATAAQTGYRYYNSNGNTVNPSFTLSANGFTKTSYSFSKWALGSASGTQYAAGASVTLSANTVMYAVWVTTVVNYAYTGGMQTFTAPADGLYQLYCKGAKGASANIATYGSNGRIGGEGGVATGKIQLKKGNIIHICVGGKGNIATGSTGAAGGYNGGGYTGITDTGGGYYGKGSGGGCTHMAFASGVLESLSNNKDKVILVAGGGGGGAYWKLGNGYAVCHGGVGGGSTGVAGSTSVSNLGALPGGGGSQTVAGAEGKFGKGGDGGSGAVYGCGGGGGWFGGGRGDIYNGPSAGGGGSGYINNTYLTEASTTQGSQNDSVDPYNGSASITFISAA